ncbi:MAG: hypothetical protein KGR98_03310 [Verrucomicrobia bacterium]|nr:hypothetical protein [Verrucomicrobiota bacterium]MDE3100494.1 hypothetical protein [Verrucomicrobiota bacterium]
MKSETTNTILIFALVVVAALDVLFGLRAISGSREFRSLNIGAQQAQQGMMELNQLRSLAGDALAYNRAHPDPQLAKILNAAGVKSVPIPR